MSDTVSLVVVAIVLLVPWYYFVVRTAHQKGKTSAAFFLGIPFAQLFTAPFFIWDVIRVAKPGTPWFSKYPSGSLEWSKAVTRFPERAIAIGISESDIADANQVVKEATDEQDAAIGRFGDRWASQSHGIVHGRSSAYAENRLTDAELKNLEYAKERGLVTNEDYERLRNGSEAAPDQTADYDSATAVSENAIGSTKDCPFCAETIKARAIVCRFCGRDLPTVS